MNKKEPVIFYQVKIGAELFYTTDPTIVSVNIDQLRHHCLADLPISVEVDFYTDNQFSLSGINTRIFRSSNSTFAVGCVIRPEYILRTDFSDEDSHDIYCEEYIELFFELFVEEQTVMPIIPGKNPNICNDKNIKIYNIMEQ